jgi:hypothetical protein
MLAMMAKNFDVLPMLFGYADWLCCLSWVAILEGYDGWSANLDGWRSMLAYKLWWLHRYADLLAL